MPITLGTVPGHRHARGKQTGRGKDRETRDTRRESDRQTERRMYRLTRRGWREGQRFRRRHAPSRLLRVPSSAIRGRGPARGWTGTWARAKRAARPPAPFCSLRDSAAPRRSDAASSFSTALGLDPQQPPAQSAACLQPQQSQVRLSDTRRLYRQRDTACRLRPRHGMRALARPAFCGQRAAGSLQSARIPARPAAQRRCHFTAQAADCLWRHAQCAPGALYARLGTPAARVPCAREPQTRPGPRRFAVCRQAGWPAGCF